MGGHRTTKYPGQNSNRLVEKDRVFFCSELIAKAYKCVRLMAPTQDSCTNFFPVAFTSEKQEIKLINGPLLGNEQVIFTNSMLGIN